MNRPLRGPAGAALGALLLAGCAGHPPTAADLPDGFYEVLARAETAAELPPDGPDRVTVVNPPLTPDDQAQVVQVGPRPTVGMLLAAPPRLDQSGDRPAILLELAPSTQQAVADFTSSHLGGQVAVVIGGEAVTVHKIREPILLPRIQITSCAEGGIERLWGALQQVR